MSYDLKLRVKVEGTNVYPTIATPELDHPTYSLSKMFRKCMDWDYSQSEKDENGEWQDCLYKCDFVLEKVRRGISELINNRAEYEQYSPENGYGTLDGAIRCLKSLETCIFETAEETGIPLDKIYMSW